MSVEAQVEGGTQHHRLHGVLAVERPGRFRLRALGPGGITLFDLLYRDGNVKVLQSLRDPSGAATARLIASLAGDLAAAYDLAPRPPGRTLRVDGAALVIADEGRTIRLSAFQSPTGSAEKAAPARIEIENRAARYRVVIEADHTTVDAPLDPALFDDGLK